MSRPVSSLQITKFNTIHSTKKLGHDAFTQDMMNMSIKRKSGRQEVPKILKE